MRSNGYELDWICVGLRELDWRERYLELAREREDTVVTMINKQLARRRLIETDRGPWSRCRLNVGVGGGVGGGASVEVGGGVGCGCRSNVEVEGGANVGVGGGANVEVRGGVGVEQTLE